MSKSDYIVVVGCGRLGGALANRLSGAGHRVLVIDRKESAFDKLSTEFTGFKILGDATEWHVLRQAEIGKADCLMAAAKEDNINLMVAQIARKIFNVPRVIARVYDPRREIIYGEFGIDTICPTNLAAETFLSVWNRDLSLTGGNGKR